MNITNKIAQLKHKTWLIKKFGIAGRRKAKHHLPEPLMPENHSRLEGSIGIAHRDDPLKRKWKRKV